MSSPTTREILRALSTNNPDRRRDRITTVYGVVLIIVMSAALLLHGVDAALSSSVKSPCLSVGFLCVGLGCTLHTARALGPAAMSPPIARWLGSTPLPRAELLQGSLRTTALLSAGVGSLFGLLTALTAGFALVPCALETLGGVIIGLASTVVALAAQRRGRAPRRGLGRGANVLLAGGVLLCALAVTRPEIFPQLAAWGPGLCLWIAACVTVVVGLFHRQAWPSSVSLAAARDAGAATHAWLDAAASLDAGGVTARSEQAHARRTGAFRSSRVYSRGPYRALLRRQVTALGRRAPRVVLWISLCAVSWLAGRLFGHVAAAIVLAWCAAGLALVLTPMVRTWLESSSLWRMFPLDPRRSVWMMALVPFFVVCITVGLAGWGSGLGPGGVALGFAALTLVLRRHQRPAIELGHTIDTPFGLIPLGIVTAIVFGTEALVTTLVVGLSFTWWVALGVSAAWFVLTATTVRPIGVHT